MAPLFGEMNRLHRLQLLLHSWKAAAKQQTQSTMLREITIFRMDFIINQATLEEYIHDEIQDDECMLEWLSEVIAVQLRKLPIQDFFSLKYGICTWGPWLQEVYQRARAIAASAFVNDANVHAYLDMMDPHDYPMFGEEVIHP